MEKLPQIYIHHPTSISLSFKTNWRYRTKKRRKRV